MQFNVYFLALFNYYEATKRKNHLLPQNNRKEVSRKQLRFQM